MLMRNRTCAVKDRCQWLHRGVRHPLLLPLLSRKPTWDRQHHPALVRVLSRGRLAKNNPESETGVSLGTDESSGTRMGVNTFFHFFEKIFWPRKLPARPPSSSKHRPPANPVFMGFQGCMHRMVFARCLQSQVLSDQGEFTLRPVSAVPTIRTRARCVGGLSGGARSAPAGSLNSPSANAPSTRTVRVDMNRIT
jgi:hypothetical protein